MKRLLAKPPILNGNVAGELYAKLMMFGEPFFKGVIMEFLEFETDDGDITVSMERISYVQKSENPEQTVMVLVDGETFTVNQEYESVSGFLMWVADGRPDLDKCPDCGESLSEHDDDDVPEEQN